MTHSRDMVKQLILEEKAGLCSGKNFWYTKAAERLGLEAVMMTDGPHGLRKQDGESDHLGINQSVPATCFPTACATASSFDTELMYRIGEALGEECLKEEVGVILGPGANSKRSPLCGRNFEYISEDPCVTGEIAAALIQGIQSKGVGTSIKHFAANSQEKCRMVSDSIVDERALREIYLAGFETAVKKAQPWTVMCSYNKLNGIYASENRRLLTDILRDEWNFKGLVVTDWGAASDRVQGILAGEDLEMPGPSPSNDKKIIDAVKAGELPEEALDLCVARILELLEKSSENKKKEYACDMEAHHGLARQAAAESAVLLKNEHNILPASREASTAVIGAFAETPRYQGAGSSKINPAKMEHFLAAMNERGIPYEYAPGYELKDEGRAEELRELAVKAAKEKAIVFLFAGLPDEYESEGFDRDNLSMPESHNRLIEEVAAVNENVVVILMCGAPVQMPWKDRVKGILLAYLGGQAGGSACADLLYGSSNPCGKLAETFPEAVEDTPCHAWYPSPNKNAEYRESIFTGYRYYLTAEKPVAFPFGFGLSYTSFEYSGLSLSSLDFREEQSLTARVSVTNTGKRAGAEIVQLYVSQKDPVIFKAERELKGFRKVFLEPGETKEVCFELDFRSFAYYDTVHSEWAVENGTYEIQIGASSADIRLIAPIKAVGFSEGASEIIRERLKDTAYYNLSRERGLSITREEFELLYGRDIIEEKRGKPFDINSTLNDIKETPAGKDVAEMFRQQAAQMLGSGGNGDIERMMQAMLMDMPLRNFMMFSGGALGIEQINGILEMLNA